MYNGIGLTTPRGSGTNGYVQRNISFIAKTRDKVNYRTEDDLKKLDALANKKPNEGILAHEKKRFIELKCLEMEEMMEEQGYSQEEITSKVSAYRKILFDKDDSLKHEVPKDDFGRPLVKESHQMAEANQEKNMKMREALGISQYFVEGSSLDPEHKAKEAAAAAAAQAEAQKQYSLVPDISSSSSPERDTVKEKSKKKKSLKKAEEPVTHKKKKISKKDRRDRSESVDEKKKKKSKKGLKEKSKYKRDKHRKRSQSFSSRDSDSSDSSRDRDSSSSLSSRTSSSRFSSEVISSSNEERQKKKKRSSKHFKNQKEKKSSKKVSNVEGASHHKDRSRKDKYESSKKKKLSSRESVKIIESSSDSSDVDSSTEQYYRLEPVFVKSKSRHKKEVQLVDAQGKKKNVFSAHESKTREKHEEKKRKRKHSSSSSYSSRSVDEAMKHLNRKRQKHSSSPMGKEKHHYEKSKTSTDKLGAKKSSKKHHQKYAGTSSEEEAGDRSKRGHSNSRSLSYSPLPNSRSTRHFSKKQSTGAHGHAPYKEILLSEGDRQMISRKSSHGGEKAETVPVSRHSKDTKSHKDENSHVSSDDGRRKDRHNGYHKSGSSRRVPSTSPHQSRKRHDSSSPQQSRKRHDSSSPHRSRKRHDSSTSASDDQAMKKRAKNGKQNLLERSPTRKRAPGQQPSSPALNRKKTGRNRSTSSSSASSGYDSRRNYEKIRERRRSSSLTGRKDAKTNSNEPSSRRKSRSRSKSLEHFEKSQRHYKSLVDKDYGRLKVRDRQSHSSTSSRDFKKRSAHHSRQRSQSSSPKRGKKKRSDTQSESSPDSANDKRDKSKKTSSGWREHKSKSKSPSSKSQHADKNININKKSMRRSRSNSSGKGKISHLKASLVERTVLNVSRSNDNKTLDTPSSPLNLGSHVSNRSSQKDATENDRNSPTSEISLSKIKNPRSSISSHQSAQGEKDQSRKSPISKILVPSANSDKSTNKNPRSCSRDPAVKKAIEIKPGKGQSPSPERSLRQNGKNLNESSLLPKHKENKSDSPDYIKLSIRNKQPNESHCKSPHKGKSSTDRRSRESSRSTTSRKSRNRSRSKSRSESRSRSRSHSRSHSRSRSRSSSQSRSRSRSKSYSDSSSRSRSYSSRSHSRSAARSPSIPRRKGSPSFLDKRRITSARKRPVPYRRPSPPTPSSLTSVSYRSHSESVSPYSSKGSSFRSRSRSLSWSPLTRHKYEITLTDIAR